MKHRFVRTSLLAALSLSLGAGACKKDEKKDDAVTEEQALTPAIDAQAAVATEEPTKEDTAEEADFFQVSIAHAPAKPTDPVVVKFPAVAVTESELPEGDSLEGATATFEIDLVQIDSGDKKRDGHLQSPDYFDAAKFPKISVAITSVKKTADSAYSATATVNAHGVTQEWPVSFQVVSEDEQGVTVEGEHAFKRTDFKVGKDKEDPAAEELTAQLRLTIPKK